MALGQLREMARDISSDDMNTAAPFINFDSDSSDGGFLGQPATWLLLAA
jgi:hypothetical protein